MPLYIIRGVFMTNLIVSGFSVDPTTEKLNTITVLDGIQVNNGIATANYAKFFCDEHIRITAVTESSGTISQLKVKYDDGAEQTLVPSGG